MMAMLCRCFVVFSGCVTRRHGRPGHTRFSVCCGLVSSLRVLATESGLSGEKSPENEMKKLEKYRST